jgi:hypothetical protein
MNINIFQKWLLFLVVLSIFNHSYAQTVPSASTLSQGSASTSLFTGRLLYSIPIYSLNDPDFDLDIALQYCTDGFKPFLSSGFYGQDWSLVAGGCITRSVQDIPDEQLYGVAEKDTVIGMLRFIQRGNIPNKDLVFNMNSEVCDSSGLIYNPGENSYTKYKIDYSPDIFSFNFGKYSGRFMINNKGKAVIINGDYINIELSDIQDRKRSLVTTHYPLQDSSSITVHTTDGYTYIFGGDKTSMEFSVLTKRGSAIVNQNPFAITAWYLTKIIAPNGRTMIFNYKYLPYNYGPNGLYSFITDYDWTEQNTNQEFPQDSVHIVYSLHKECILSSIQILDSIPLSISFSSSAEHFKMYEHSSYQYCVPHLKLDSITIAYNGTTLRTAKLSYQYRSYSTLYGDSNNNHWRYLHKVSISGKGTYTMEYYDSRLHDPFNNLVPLSSYPNINVSKDNEYKTIVDRFGFWTRTSLQGLLEEVCLPTGGRHKFTYGSHQYGEERRFRITGNQDVELYSQVNNSQSIGGARIEKIETFLEDSTLIETKAFSYTKSDGNSSGVFYNVYEIFTPSNPNKGYPIANPYNYSMIDSHIGYSSVTQTITSGFQTYKTTYSFDTGKQYYTSVNSGLIHRSPTAIGNNSTELQSGSLTYDGTLRIIGKLLRVDQYRGNILSSSKQFKYNGVSNEIDGVDLPTYTPLGNTDTIVCLSKYSALIARKLIVSPEVTEAVVSSEYDSDTESMVSAISTTYDSKFRKKRISAYDSNNISHFTKYTYPDEINVSDDDFIFNPNALSLLRRSNRISEPIETVSGYMENNHEYLTSGKINLYTVGSYLEYPPKSHHAPSHNPVVPDWLDSISYPGGGIRDSLIESVVMIRQYPYLHKTLSLSMTEPIADYQAMGANGSIVTYDDRYALDMEYGFDPMGRPTFVKPFGASATTYTWEGIYPKTKSVGKQKYTYTYIPYVGINSVTDPRGITTYYTYDANGRLVETYQIVNGKKQILNVYQYHLKTE